MWLMALPSGLWTDEAATAFVARYPHDPSLAAATPYTQSIYYLLPRAMDALFGFSEIAYRIPSVLAMALALWFMARLAARIIHRDAAWFVVFACLAIPGIDYFAVDAKPYALGMCCAAAALYYLAAWLDSSRWLDAILFLLPAALLWRVQQVYWPFYLVFGIYAFWRVARRETPVGRARTLAVFCVLAVLLLPVALDALALLRTGAIYAFAPPPPWLELRRVLRRDWNFIAICGGLAWLAARLWRWRKRWTPRGSDVALALSWWLVTPVAVFEFSRHSSESLFVPRYISLSLPGVAMAAAMAAALYIPRGCWRLPSIALGAGALIFTANWSQLWPEHDPAAWRSPAQYVNSVATGADTPILCISPFVQGAPPVWRPDYPLPGFLYAQLFAYPVRAKPYLLPAGPVREAWEYAASLAAGTLPHYRQFLVYGGIRGAEYWREWLSARPELHGWRSHARDFGDIRVVVFSRTDPR